MKLPIGNLSLGPLAKGALRIGKALPGTASRKGAPPSDTPIRPARRRVPLNKATLAVGSGVTIFAIGFAMQNFGTPPAASQTGAERQPAPVTTQSLAALPGGVDVEAVIPTAAGDLPQDAPQPVLPQDRVTLQMPDATAPSDLELARLQDAATPTPLQAASSIDLSPVLASVIGGDSRTPDTATSAPVLPCEIAMTADPAPAAMVDLTVDASCLPEERFTLHHNGMMFHALTGKDGLTRLRVPALAENAVFIASFSTGDGAVAQIDVPTLAFYDRVVVQWRGDAGLGLHALEFDSAYFGKGHVHADAPGDMANATRGASGFLTRFGQDTGPAALMAEVYTFPSRLSETGGRIGLSVEAEVTADNCDREVEAQTLQLKAGESLRTNDLTLYMPACDASGDFLVLKNLLEDLKVAAN
ncbi:MAG: translocase [Rhodobacteraceae bacterium]|nr:MAG: translocase [Paracoccaceae bacterium]